MYQIKQPQPHQWLTTGNPYLIYTQLSSSLNYSIDFLIAKDITVRHEVNAFSRHTVDAAQITAVSY